MSLQQHKQFCYEKIIQVNLVLYLATVLSSVPSRNDRYAEGH